MALRVLTLGPSGSCHEAAVSHYLTANGLSGRSEILFTFDLVAGMDDLASGAVDLLVSSVDLLTSAVDLLVLHS